MKILLLETNDADAELFTRTMTKVIGDSLEIKRLTSVQEALPEMKAVDVVVADLTLKDTHGFETIEQIYKSYPFLPLIVLSVDVTSDFAAQAIRYGAHDYLVKGVIPPAAIFRCIRSAIIRKQLEMKLVLTSENKSAFLSRMSHEIRTPLNVVLGLLDNLWEEQPREDQKQWLRTAISAGETLKMLINDILDLSKVEAGKLSISVGNFDLHRLLKNSHALFINAAEAKGLALELKIGNSLPKYVMGDAHRIQQILTNLIGNSLKFTSKGKVVISVERGIADTTVFTVSDTGKGISTKQIEALFTPFEQGGIDTHKEFGGTGLGLAISRQLSEMMHGAIAVESTENIGSKFEVTLPLPAGGEPSEHCIAEATPTVDFSVIKGKRVLIIEDDQDNQFLFTTYFRNVPIEFSFASDGSEALEQLQNATWDIVLLDNQIPDPSGVAVLQWLRNHESKQGLKKVPVIAISADAMEKSAFLEFKHEFSGFLIKPFKRMDLLNCMIAIARS